MIRAMPPNISSRVALMGAKLVVEMEEIAVLAMSLVQLPTGAKPNPVILLTSLKGPIFQDSSQKSGIADY